MQVDKNGSRSGRYRNLMQLAKRSAKKFDADREVIDIGILFRLNFAINR